MELAKRLVSPFDSIRRVHESGAEYWSARELMPLLGYAKWERFDSAIQRAKLACQNSGINPEDQFPGAGKQIAFGKGAAQDVQDYHLTRYACYLVAMNGDPRKEQIAQAQTYFAVKTREAEIQAPRNFKEALQALIAREEEKERLEARVKELEPFAAWAEDMLKNSEGVSIRDAAKVMNTGQRRLFTFLRERGYLMADNTPYQRHVDSGLFVVSERQWFDKERQPRLYVKTLITPKGVRRIQEEMSRPGAVITPRSA